MKTSQFIILFMVVLFSMTTSAFKINSKYEYSNKKENHRTREEIVKSGIYKKHKDARSNGRLSSFKSNITNKNSNKPKFIKRDEYNDCSDIPFIIESYMENKIFHSSKSLCSNNVKEYLENIRKFQECYPENNLGFALETEIYIYCMVDDNGNLCPMARLFNRNKDIKLSPSIKNYMLNCRSEKCRLQSLHLNKIHRESFGERITFLDNEKFDEVENYLNSSECRAMTLE